MERTFHVMLAILVVCLSQQTTWADPKPIHFTIVMHIEGYGPSERTDEIKFTNHKSAMNTFIMPFENRGGKLLAHAVEDCKFLEIARTDMERLCEGHPRLGFQFMKNTAQIIGQRYEITRRMLAGEIQHNFKQRHID